MAIAEATRFPEGARLFFRTGPARVQALLAGRLAGFRDHGHPWLNDPETIAALFIQMVLGDFQRQVAMAVRAPPSPAEARAQATLAADLLMRGVRAPAERSGTGGTGGADLMRS